MGTYFNWPWKRKEYAGVGNPRFVSDILSDNELALEGLKNILGLTDTDFAIISGLEYDSGTVTYNPGTIFFNGVFYSVLTPFLEGLYLAPNVIDSMPQPFNDGNSRNIYSVYTTTTTTNPTGSTPQFSGSMNLYRINSKLLKQSVDAINATLSYLGDAAFKDVGTTPGTVAAGDASYTKTASDNKYVAKAGDTMTGALVLPADPTAALQAATKQYVDAKNAYPIFYTGTVRVGDITSNPLSSPNPPDTSQLSFLPGGASSNFDAYKLTFPSGYTTTNNYRVIAMIRNDAYIDGDNLHNNNQCSLQLGKVQNNGFYFSVSTSDTSSTQDIWMDYFLVKIS